MKLSPMMQEYVKTKEQYQDCILLYRLGDFYEMFFEDAILASRELELTLTKKACGLEEKAPMAGMPHHSSPTYIQRLVEKGYKVAICEQLEDASQAKGLVKRGVVKVVTPGTIVEGSMVDERKNNYIVCINSQKNEVYIAGLDLTTGKFLTTIINKEDKKYNEVKAKILDEISRFTPKEVIVNEEIYKDVKLIEHLENILNIYVTKKSNSYFDITINEEDQINSKYNLVLEVLSNSIQKKDNKYFEMKLEQLDFLNTVSKENEEEIEVNEVEVEKKENDNTNLEALDNTNSYLPSNNLAIVGIDKYVKETQMLELSHIKNIQMYKYEGYMALDSIARKNLEINYRLSDQSKKGSLLWVLDKTNTSMGARLLSRIVNDPLINKEEIEKRLDAVEEFKTNIILKGNIIELLKKVYDIERIAGKVAFGSVNGKDMITLKNSIEYLPSIKNELKDVKSDYLKEILNNLDTLEDIYKIIELMIVDEPPLTITEGNLIKETFDEDVRRLRNMSISGKEWIANLEAQERERTDIKTLKIGYNKIFGYYLEVTNMNKDKVPDTYIRKQTLANAERYVTPELKQMEEELLNAESKVNKIEYELFLKLKENIEKEIQRIKRASDNIALIDVLVTFAQVAEDNNYIKPKVNTNGILDIKNGRHPVVEKTLKNEDFVDNDCYLDNNSNTVMLITGPNMSGKSTFMRQTALITLMAQIGSFVPASSANISIVDKIFTRIGASDDLSMGQSTFMMEMSEVANILNNATKNSLVILDEIGRGTSTYDGMSIAQAVVEYIADKKEIGCKTLFATHYHELVDLEYTHDNIKNFHVDAKEIGNDVIFLRKLIPGGTDESYGIHVAKLAGVPTKVLNSSRKILRNIEKEKKKITLINNENTEDLIDQTNLFTLSYESIIKKLEKVNVNEITPINAFNLILELKEELDDK